MTYTISDQCIACQNCLPQCPTNAIQKNEQGKFSINSNLCNDCLGFYGVAQCMAGCPTSNGCTPTISTLIKVAQVNSNNYWHNWFVTYNRLTSRLKAKQESKYWQHWFDTYSQKLANLVISH